MENEGSENEQTQENNDKVRLNVSGMVYEIRWKTLLKFPQTRLGRLAIELTDHSVTPEYLRSYCDDYDMTIGEAFFERDPTAFPAILNYYITGKLHLPRSDCIKTFEEEVIYWGVPFEIGQCCDSYYYGEWECEEAVKKADQMENTLKKKEKEKPEKETTKWSRIQGKIWNLFENPETSTAANIVSVISNLIVVLSTVILCVNTHPDLKTDVNGVKGDNPHLTTIELVCVLWFTIEYLARLISCPDKKKFLTGGLNAIDLLAVLPYYIGKIIEAATGGISSNFKNVRRFIQILRIIRIVRIFKLARHSTGLQVLAYTLRESSEELGLLALLLMMGVTLFATLVYYAEEHVPGTKFKSITEGLWWATVSITTVGYGDMNPETTFGKIIGSLCCVCGILFIALPIPTIVGNFSKYYSEHRIKQKLDLQKTESVVPVFEEYSAATLDRARRVSMLRQRRSTVKPMNFMPDIQEI